MIEPDAVRAAISYQSMTCCWKLSLALTAALAAASAAARTPDFESEVRPLLAEHCWSCHGADADEGRTTLRLDSEAGALAPLYDGGFAIVPGKPEESELIRRIGSEDPEVRMPPASRGHDRLEPAEIELLTEWIGAGASWAPLWSFVPLARRPPPPVHEGDWVVNPIDAFILARLEEEGLRPSEAADRTTLIRRVSLDLTGLPPTPGEVEAFEADASETAYEKVVDRLLASVRYGERMAAHWLDLARYADTNGYQEDRERDMWRWRDWVINAFNSNLPYDRFTVEQLAGDLLPEPSLEQLIATGFNRNHSGNTENGVDPEEYQIEYAADRAETTATVWLGLTMACARCHDHKYDPISQKEYYSLLAYFNNVSDRGRYFKHGNTPPTVLAPTDRQQRRLADLDRRIASVRRELDDLEPLVEQALAADLTELGPRASSWSFDEGLVASRSFDRPADSFVRTEGVVGDAAMLAGDAAIEIGDLADFDFDDEFTLSAWIRPERATGGIVSRYEPTPFGYGLFLVDGKAQVRLDTDSISDRMRAESAEPVPLGEWTHVAATYDGSRLASGIRLYFNGSRVAGRVLVDESLNSTRSRAPLRAGHGPGEGDYLSGAMDEVRVFDRALGPEQVEVVALRESVPQIAALPAAERSAAQRRKLRWAWLEELGPPRLTRVWSAFRALELERDALVAGFPTVMVMDELEQARPTHVLARGSFDAPGEEVDRGTPAVLPPLAADLPSNRLGLALWLTDPAHPLTSRVAVNRFWQMFFGRGLVVTPENFGSRGSPPTHPELLDWLAIEFIESGWDLKALIKTIVTSATYRQKSRASPALVEKDPLNRLLARMPRLRLPAEAVRDQALAVAGLLTEKVGGPPVRPYQPPGLWEGLANEGAYEHGDGDDLYRRSLYTFWKRTIPPPGMMIFDSASRETCAVSEARTDTPIQALNLMNDVTYVESARLLAERMIRDGGPGRRQRLVHGFRLATSRWPDTRESQILLEALERFRRRYRSSPRDARRLVGAGVHPSDRSIPVTELAAYTAVASLLLNLDEVITRG